MPKNESLGCGASHCTKCYLRFKCFLGNDFDLGNWRPDNYAVMYSFISKYHDECACVDTFVLFNTGGSEYTGDIYFHPEFVSEMIAIGDCRFQHIERKHMIVCLKCKREMRCKKNGVGVRYNGTHVYYGDSFECPECKSISIVCNTNPCEDSKYQPDDIFMDDFIIPDS